MEGVGSDGTGETATRGPTGTLLSPCLTPQADARIPRLLSCRLRQRETLCLQQPLPTFYAIYGYPLCASSTAPLLTPI